MVELKHCPCGGEAKIWNGVDLKSISFKGNNYAVVMCSMCGITTPEFHYPLDDDQELARAEMLAIEYWNRKVANK